jgi:hypothetical protein
MRMCNSGRRGFQDFGGVLKRFTIFVEWVSGKFNGSKLDLFVWESL